MKIDPKELEPKGPFEIAMRGSLRSFSRLQDELLDSRESQRVSQARLAEEMGVSQPMVSKIESSNTEIQVATLVSYAAAMGLSIKFEIEKPPTN